MRRVRDPAFIRPPGYLDNAVIGVHRGSETSPGVTVMHCIGCFLEARQYWERKSSISLIADRSRRPDGTRLLRFEVSAGVTSSSSGGPGPQRSQTLRGAQWYHIVRFPAGRSPSSP